MLENIEVTIGKNIRARRLKLGWTQEHLAELAEMHPVSFNKIENGGRGSSRKAIAKIAKALGCSVEDLHLSSAKKSVALDDQVLAAIERGSARVQTKPLEEENASLKERIAELEGQLATLRAIEENFSTEGAQLLAKTKNLALAGAALQIVDPEFVHPALRRPEKSELQSSAANSTSHPKKR